MKLPPANGCAVCGNVTSKQCSRCKMVKYCSEACQRSDWSSVHKSRCRDFQSSLEGNSEQSASTLQRRKSFGNSHVPFSGKNNILNQSKKVLFPYEEFMEFFYWDSPGYRPCGLKNCGNSCYANVVLQCLTQTKPLVAYLLEKGHRKECRSNGWCFLCEFQLHVERARWCPQTLSPNNIISRLPSIGANLSCGKQEDAHEFMRFAVDSMQSVFLDEFDGDKAVPLSIRETTIIQHIFGGRLHSRVSCTKCGNITNQFENMMDLTVEIRKDAESLEDCLDQFTAEECIDGENLYKCDRCNDYVEAWKSLRIREAPNILTIALKRFQRGGFGKLNKRVIFPESLYLNPYMSKAGDDNDSFKLYAVIVHVNMLNTSYSGHYICYIKNFSGNWYRVDDSQVFNVYIDEVLSQEAYMLLYSRITARPTSLYPLELLNKEDHAIVKAEGKQYSPLQPLECHKTTVSPAICADPASLPTDNRSEIFRAKEELLSVTNFEGGKEDQDMVNSEASGKVLQELQDVGASGAFEATSHLRMLLPPCSVFYNSAEAVIQKPEGGRFLVSDFEEKTETCKGTVYESLFKSSSEDSVATDDRFLVSDIEEETETCKGTAYEFPFRNSSEDSGATNGEMQYLDVPISLSSSEACQRSDWNSGHKKVLFPYEEFVEFFYWDSPGYPPCGLINHGNSCYANVVLQSLTQTKPLVAYLLEKGHKGECRLNGWCFLCKFQLHVERAEWCRRPFSPTDIISRLPNIGDNLSCGKQEDAHEFMRFAIDTMQSVLLDEFDGDKAVPLSTRETTIIQHIFGGHLQSQVSCTKCGNASKQFENMMDLTVEIHGDAESLEECLDHFTTKECMDGENMYKCDRCNDYVKAWKSLTIREAPNILTIVLKRFQREGAGKLNKRVIFPESLDLNPYMSEAGDDDDFYQLYAVIVHVGVLNASHCGHYICYIKDFSGNWYRVDDDQVFDVDIDEVLSQEEAYMLLYSRMIARPTSLYPCESLNKEDHAIVKAEGMQYSPLQPLECHKTTVSPAICADPASLPTDNRSQIVRAKEELLSVTNFKGGKEDQDMVDSGASHKGTEEEAETCKGTAYESLLGSSREDSVATNGEMQNDASAHASASGSSSSELDNSTLLPKKAKCEKEFSSRGVHDVILKTDGGISSGKKLKPLCFFGKRPRDKCAKEEVRGEVCQNSTLCDLTNACVQSGLSCEKTKLEPLCTSGFLVKRSRNKRLRDKCAKQEVRGEVCQNNAFSDPTNACAPSGLSCENPKSKPLFTPGFLGKRPRNKCAKQEVKGEVCQSSTLSDPTNACMQSGLSCEKPKLKPLFTPGFLGKLPRDKCAKQEVRGEVCQNSALCDPTNARVQSGISCEKPKLKPLFTPGFLGKRLRDKCSKQEVRGEVCQNSTLWDPTYARTQSGLSCEKPKLKPLFAPGFLGRRPRDKCAKQEVRGEVCQHSTLCDPTNACVQSGLSCEKPEK